MPSTSPPALCWHLTFAAAGRHPLCPREEDRRAVVRRLARAAWDEVVLFSVVDDHLHLVIRADRGRAGAVARGVVLSLQPVTAALLEPARIRPVESRGHLERLVPYVLTQVEHHGLDSHPALWTGSSFQDLVGARAFDGLRPVVGDLLPRLRLRQVLPSVGLPPVEIGPADDDAVRAVGVSRVVAAAAAAVSAGPALAGNSPPVVRARRVIGRLAAAAGIPSRDVAWAAGVSGRSARRLVHAATDEAGERAARVRLALEDAVRAVRDAAPPRPG